VAHYMRVSAPLIASPVYTLPAAPLFCLKAVGPPSQAEIVPFKLAKMKRADLPSQGSPASHPTGNEDVLVLLTWPVGPCGPDAVVGMGILPLVIGGAALLTVVLSVTA